MCHGEMATAFIPHIYFPENQQSHVMNADYYSVLDTDIQEYSSSKGRPKTTRYETQR